MSEDWNKTDKKSDNIIVLEDRINAQSFFDFLEVQSSFKNHKINEKLFLKNIKEIENKGTPIIRKKAFLSLLSQIKKVEIYRFLENFAKKADPDIKDWALLAYAESNAQLRKFLTNEDAIVIVSGLGGKNNKVRFFTLFYDENKKNLDQGQINLIKTELKYLLEKYNFELEEFKHKDFWFSFTSLFSLDNEEIEHFAREFIEIIRGYGINLSKNFLLNNIEEIEEEVISEIFKHSYKNGIIKMPLKPNLKQSSKTDDINEIKEEIEHFILKKEEIDEDDFFEDDDDINEQN